MRVAHRGLELAHLFAGVRSGRRHAAQFKASAVAEPALAVGKMEIETRHVAPPRTQRQQVFPHPAEPNDGGTASHLGLWNYIFTRAR